MIDLIARCEALSPREKDVLRALGKHRRAKEIARDLNISEHTVRSYAGEARQKLGVYSTRDAALLFLEYEATISSPQNRGDEFRRVAPLADVEETSGHGFRDVPRSGAHEETGKLSNSGGDISPELEPAFPTPPDREAQAQGKQVGRAGEDVGAAIATKGGGGTDVHSRLGQLNPTHWVGLSLALTLAVIAAFGIGAVSLLGVFEVLQQIGGPQH